MAEKDDTWEVIHEGLARVKFRKGEVFYNPVQVVNRDLSVLMLRDFVGTRKRERDEMKATRLTRAKKEERELTEKEKVLNARGEEPLTVLEALSATGLRAVRYRLEVPGLGRIVANDIEEAAFEAIQRNIALNDNVHVDASHRDAVDAMMDQRAYRHNRFDVVDLDPYGSASPLLDSAVQSVSDGGLLCITSTDGPVLCGNNPEVCLYRYGTMSVKSSSFSHELAIRTVLACVQRDANRYQRVIEPLLCVFSDFYVRIFVRVFDKKAALKRSPMRVGMLFYCCSCHSFETQPMGTERKSGVAASRVTASSSCRTCSRSYTIVGPVWLDKLHDMATVRRLYEALDDKSSCQSLKMRERVQALLRVVLEEVEDVPFFLNLTLMIQTLHATSPPQSAIFAYLASRGYRVSASHTLPWACKTDAPQELVWDVIRCWVKRHPPRKPEQGSVAETILAREPTHVKPEEVNFNAKYYAPGRRPDAKAARFPQNPTKFWGPGTRATGKRPAEDDKEDEENKRPRMSADREPVPALTTAATAEQAKVEDNAP